MGHTLARRTVNNVLNTMSESHFKSFEDFITEATEHKWLIVLKNWFMLSVRISSYGCTREVWRARKKRKSCSRR